MAASSDGKVKGNRKKATQGALWDVYAQWKKSSHSEVKWITGVASLQQLK